MSVNRRAPRCRVCGGGGRSPPLGGGGGGGRGGLVLCGGSGGVTSTPPGPIAGSGAGPNVPTRSASRRCFHR